MTSSASLLRLLQSIHQPLQMATSSKVLQPSDLNERQDCSTEKIQLEVNNHPSSLTSTTDPDSVTVATEASIAGFSLPQTPDLDEKEVSIASSVLKVDEDSLPPNIKGYTVELDGVFALVKRTSASGRSWTFPARIARYTKLVLVSQNLVLIFQVAQVDPE